MNARQLVIIALCGLFLTPAPGVLAAEGSASNPRHDMPNAVAQQESDEDENAGYYIPEDNTYSTGHEYTGLAILDQQGNVLEGKTTVEPGETLRVEVELQGGMDYPYQLAAGPDGEVVLTTTKESGGARFAEGDPGGAHVVFEVSYATLDDKRDQLSDNLTIVVQGSNFGISATPSVSHFDLGGGEPQKEVDNSGSGSGQGEGDSLTPEWDLIPSLTPDDEVGSDNTETPPRADNEPNSDSNSDPDTQDDTPSSDTPNTGPDNPKLSDTSYFTITLLTDRADLQEIGPNESLEAKVRIDNPSSEPMTEEVRLIVNGGDGVTKQVSLEPDEYMVLPFGHVPADWQEELHVRFEGEGDAVEFTTHVTGVEQEAPANPIESAFSGCDYASVSGTFREDNLIYPTVWWSDEKDQMPIGSDGEYGISGEEIDTPFTGEIAFQLADVDKRTIERSEGEILVTIPKRDNRTTIMGVHADPSAEQEEYTTAFMFHNPNDCIDAVQPDRPSITVKEVTPTGDGTYDVTFVARNPNERNMNVYGNFVTGTTDSDAPALLRPGKSTFTVTWTPESSDERLVYSGDLSWYGYDKPLRAETKPISAYTGTVKKPSPGPTNETETIVANFNGCKGVTLSGTFHSYHVIAPAISWYSEMGDRPIATGEYAVSVEDDLETPYAGTMTFSFGHVDSMQINQNKRDNHVEVTIPFPDRAVSFPGVMGVNMGAGNLNNPQGKYTFENPNDCHSFVQPTRPNATVQSVEPKSDGAFEVTFRIDNPNSGPLAVDSALHGRTTAKPPQNIDSGVTEFTVEWSPKHPADRFALDLDVSAYGFDDPVIAATKQAENYRSDSGDQNTETATEGGNESTAKDATTENTSSGGNASRATSNNITILPTVYAGPELSIQQTNTPVDTGQPVRVTAALTNSGPDPITKTVRLIVGKNPEQVDSTTITVASGETKTVTLGYQTPTVKHTQTFPVRVKTSEMSDSQSITVHGTSATSASGSDGGSTTSAVAITGTNTPLAAGKYLEVTARVENTGDAPLTKDVALIVGHDPEQVGSKQVTLPPGESTTVSLGYTTPRVENDQRFPVRMTVGEQSDEKSVLVRGTT